MRIGIDIRSLQNDSSQRGIGTYTRELVKGLIGCGVEREYVFFAFANRPVPAFLQGTRVKMVTRRIPYVVWISSQLLLPQACQREKLDIFYSPENHVPIFARCATAITVHDFINREYSVYRTRSRSLRKAYFYVKDRTLQCADGIIAVSQYTKNKIGEFVRLNQNKIRVIYEAAGKEFVPFDDPLRFCACKQKYGIDDEFLLYVGAVDYHKNIDGLIRAFAAARLSQVSLVCAGVHNDPMYSSIVRDLVCRCGIGSRVSFLGYVPQEDLVCLYNMCRAFISVSFYEGFGLPCLEAMSCGRPVIVSGNTSMKEIVGSAGLLVNPECPEEITAAIETIMGDEKASKSLADAALARSREFSWKKTAIETLEFFKELKK